MFPDERLNHAVGEVAARPGGTPAFSGQPVGHGAMRMPLPTQLGEATNQSVIVADLGPVGNRSADLRLSPDTSGPVTVHPNRFGRSHHRDDDALQQQSHQFLAISHRRRGSPPKGRDILGQTPNGLLLHGVWADRFARLKLLVLGLQMLLRRQRRLPVPLQGSGDQAVLRFHRGVHSTSSIGVIACPLQAQLPVTVVLGAFQFEVLGQTQAGFQGRRRNRLEHEIRDMIVQSTAGPWRGTPRYSLRFAAILSWFARYWSQLMYAGFRSRRTTTPSPRSWPRRRPVAGRPGCRRASSTARRP